MTTAAIRSPQRAAEHRFFACMAWACLILVFAGFARSFFLRPWFPELHARTPAESFFYFHGALFAAWFALLVVQSALVATRRVALHRKLGWVGSGLAAAMVLVGSQGALIAARRPTGFIGPPVPPQQFLIVPLTDMLMFGLFVALAVVRRGDAQSHKRFMLVASANLLAAAVARLPFPPFESGNPLLYFGGADLPLLALVAWDLVTRRRIHGATLIGLVATVGAQLGRLALSGTELWARVAGWLIG